MKIDEAKDALTAWSRNGKFIAKTERSKNIIMQALKLCKNPYVSFSCGKDSSVLAHLVLDIKKDVPLRFLSSGETRLVHNVDRIIEHFKDKGAVIHEINIDRVFSPEWKDATWTEQRKAGRGDLEKLNEGGYDCVIMGLRKEESRNRQISLTAIKTEGFPPYTYRYKSGLIRCCPLAEWTTIAVAAYIASKGLPVLDWYEYEGIEGRTTARLTGDAVRQNVLIYLKQKDPGSFNKLVARFPEFGLYI